MRSRKWANHNTYDRLPGRPLGPSGENVSGEGAARYVEGSERQLLLRDGRRHSGAGGEKRWIVERELRSYGRARACISLANTPHSAQKAPSLVAALKQRQSAKGTPALASNTTRHGASAFVQVLSTTSPLFRMRRLVVPPWPKRAPLQRKHALRAPTAMRLCF